MVALWVSTAVERSLDDVSYRRLSVASHAVSSWQLCTAAHRSAAGCRLQTDFYLYNIIQRISALGSSRSRYSLTVSRTKHGMMELRVATDPYPERLKLRTLVLVFLVRVQTNKRVSGSLDTPLSVVALIRRVGVR